IWKDLFGRASAMNVFDVLEMLKNLDLPRWKRLPLALIVLVDGVLFCNSKNLALTEKYVEMLTDLDRFMLYPWGRAITDAEKRENPLTRLRRQLKQKASACYGFPLSLQLMVLQSIPMLVSKIPQPDNLKTFVEDPEGCQNVITLLHLGDILAVESDPLMVVDDGDNDQQNELRWGDEVEDAEVAFMQELMAEGYKFTTSDFAVAPAPIVDLSDAEDDITNEQEPEPSTRPKKKLKTHQTEKRKMQRKRGRGKNSSNLSEDETPQSGQIEDLKRWIVSQNNLLLRKIKTELDKRLGAVANEEDSNAGKDYHTAPEDASDASQKTPCTPKPPQEVEGSSGVKRKSRGTGRGGRGRGTGRGGRARGKRARVRSDKIRDIYTADSKVKALFVSRSKAPYKPLETVEQDHFKAFQELLSRERNM
ncbi:hypothetical protein EUTSA_v10005322mg, partial [Eutrema salsugineum]